MRDSVRLVLNYDGLSKRMESAYKDLADSQALREAFLTDPLGVILNYIHPNAKFVDQDLRISAGNYLLLCLLSNQKFTQWVEDYNKGVYEAISKKFPDVGDQELKKLLLLNINKQKVHDDLSNAIFSILDKQAFQAFLLLASQSRFDQTQGERLLRPERDRADGDTDVESIEGQVGFYYISETFLAYNGIVAINTTYAYNHTKFLGTTEESYPTAITRSDVESISRLFSTSIVDRANALRSEGALESFVEFEQRQS